MNLSTKHIVLIAISVFGLAIAIFTGIMVFGPASKAFGFAADRGRLEGIVSAVDARLKAQDSLAQYRLTDLKDPNSLVPIPALEKAIRGQGAGTVSAIRHGENLQVWIETEDRGHAGEFGYMYQRQGEPQHWDADRFGERWQTGDQLDAHWWAIANRLD